MPPELKSTRIAPSRNPNRPWEHTRLLAVDRKGERINHGLVTQLQAHLRPGDLLVLNDAATLPASLSGFLGDQPIELRLATTEHYESFPAEWTAVIFGGGDWRTDTDMRPKPPPVLPGAELRFSNLSARVEARHLVSPRLLQIRFDRSGEALGRALFEWGRPVQYSHLDSGLGLSQVQTPYAGRPWAIEMPSTGRPLRWPLLKSLVKAGVEIAWLTEAAGLSATGDAAIDRMLPLAERYEIPGATAEAIGRAKQRGNRVIAVGTTVVRALEASGGTQGRGLAKLRLDAQSRLAIVDGLLTGIHSPGESHWELLKAFGSVSLLQKAHATAIGEGYLGHEHGDLMLVL